MRAEIPPGRIDASYVATVRPEVASIEVDSEIVVYDDATKMMHRLDATASVVWNCIDGESSISEIAADIADAYGAPRDRVISDVVTMLRHLGAKGLLRDVLPDRPEGDLEPARQLRGGAAIDGDDPFVAEPGST